MLKPCNIDEEERIIRDCVKAARNIETMTDRAYHFLYCSNGFIAHYDKYGFMEEYRDPGSLKKAIFYFQMDNQNNNFHPNDDAYDYYMQKKKIYNEICNCLNQGIEYKKHMNNLSQREFDFDRL